jgi:hypothetical protein
MKRVMATGIVIAQGCLVVVLLAAMPTSPQLVEALLIIAIGVTVAISMLLYIEWRMLEMEKSILTREISLNQKVLDILEVLSGHQEILEAEEVEE